MAQTQIKTTTSQVKAQRANAQRAKAQRAKAQRAKAQRAKALQAKALQAKALRIAFISTFIVSFIVGVALIQNHTTVKYFAAQKISQLMKESLDCNFNHTIDSFNLFKLQLTCKDIHVTPINHNLWSWHCHKLTFDFSWFSLLFHQKLDANITTEGLVTRSICDHASLPIADHLKRLFFGAKLNVPLAIKSLKIRNAILILNNAQHDLNAQIYWDGFSKKINDQLKSILYIKKGSLTHKSNPIISYLNGQLYSILSRQGTNTVFIDNTVTIAKKNKSLACNETWYITGEIHNKNGHLNIYNTNDTCTVNLAAQNNILTCNGSIYTKLITEFLQNDMLPSDTLTFEGKVNLNEHLDHKGSLSCAKLPIKGSWSGNKNKTSLSITNTGKIEISPFTLEPHKAQIHIEHQPQDNVLKTNASCDLYHARCNKTIPINATLNLAKKLFQLEGNVDAYTYKASGKISPKIKIAQCIISSPKKNKLCSLHCSYKSGKLSINNTIHLQEIYHFLPETIRQFVDGSVIIQVKGESSLKNTFLHITLKKGGIILGKTYNMVTNLSAHAQIDHLTKKLTIKNVLCTLHQGSITSPHATITFNNAWTPTFISLPITLKKCLLGSNKNLGLFSGSILLSYSGKTPTIDGTIRCEKVHLHNLGPFLQKTNSSSLMLSYSPKVNLLLEAKKPIRVRTTHIETSLYPYLSCSYENNQPKITGTITLRGGSVLLPYSRIKLLRGSMHFTSDNSLDPCIDLIAKTTIRNYSIIIFVGGTLKNPIFRLSSSPSLPEEKITSLILAGSKELSFNTLVPTLIFEYLKNILIESGTNLPASKRHIQRLIKPLKYIKFTPQFTDETGKKGLSGGVELDIGKRLQAKIKKNLNAQDEPAMEINYKPSEGLCFKAFRDEQGSIGSQVEMKFKL